MQPALTTRSKCPFSIHAMPSALRLHSEIMIKLSSEFLPLAVIITLCSTKRVLKAQGSMYIQELWKEAFQSVKRLKKKKKIYVAT